MIARWLAAFVIVSSAAASEHGAMVLIPAGEFTMGRTKLTADDKTNMRPHVLLDDRPARTVNLGAYYLDAYEVTNAQYATFVKSRNQPPPRHWRNGDVPKGEESFPVFNVDWEDATAYCDWAGKRLPTEAEWERAARGELDSMDFPWGDKPDAKKARYNSPQPGPVGAFPPNGFGLYDMAGGVSEWCADWFDRLYYQHGPAGNPKGPETGEYKVIRGGAWSDAPKRVTVFFRNWVRPNQKTPNLGFRCAKSQ